MPIKAFEINLRETEGIVIVDLKGRLVLGPDDVAFRQFLEKLLAAGKTKVIVNLRDVSSIDTAGVGSLVSCAQKLRNAGGRMALLNVSPAHASLDELLKLDTTFESYAEESDAVNSFFPDRALPHYDLLEFLEEEAKHRPVREAES